MRKNASMAVFKSFDDSSICRPSILRDESFSQDSWMIPLDVGFYSFCIYLTVNLIVVLLLAT